MENSGDKKDPVKIRLARKWAILREADNSLELDADERMQDMALAYLAGFDRAKALCVDFIQRYVDRRPGMTEDEEAEWFKKFNPKKKQPSEHMATIGERP